MFAIYSLLSCLIHLMLSPYFLGWPPARRKYWPSVRQRLGLDLPEPTPAGSRSIWIHAVSVGEVLAVRPLVQRLADRHDLGRIVVSTITLTGQQLAKKHFPALTVFYFPIDWGFIIRRFLKTLRPELILLAESEIWPNLFRLAKREDCRVIIVNGRFTERSTRRYRQASFFFRRIFRLADMFLLQTGEDAERILSLGTPPERVRVIGNLKYDLKLETTPPLRNTLHVIQRCLGVRADTPLLVAGSTMPGEEAMLLEILRDLRKEHPELKCIVAPRHPERFDAVFQLLQRSSLQVVRRSDLDTAPEGDSGPDEALSNASPPADVLLLDTMGELAHVYQIACLAFVGGSLVPLGGHNIVEPAYFGKAILFGPHMENFREAAQRFLSRQGALQATGPEHLKRLMHELLSNSEDRIKLGQRAQEIMAESGGALERALELILPHVAGARRTL